MFRTRPSNRQTGPSCLQPLLSPDWPILPTAPPIARLAHLAYNPSHRQTGPSCLQPLPSSDWPILPTAPPIARLAHLAYSSPSTVLASSHPICSATGIQQADPLGPVLFAMAVDEVASSQSSKKHIWYLDDATSSGQAESVFADVKKCVTELKKIGLKGNPSKCDVINMRYQVDEFTKLVMTLA